MGILDNKSRIIDAIITSEGRRQMSEGTFNVSYVTFTDADVSYLPDVENGHEDPTSKLYFEAANLPQDQIVFEANDEGKLVPFKKQNLNLGINLPFGEGSSQAQGEFINGKLSAYSYYHGRTIKTFNFLKYDKANDEKGFIYCDGAGAFTASILIKPDFPSEFITGSFAGCSGLTGKPYKAYIGTKDGLDAQSLAKCIVRAISLISSSEGPSVFATQQANVVFLDSKSTENIASGQILKITPNTIGSITSSLSLEGPVLGGKLHREEIEVANFSSQITDILSSSFDNFQDLKIISTIDRLFEDDNFSIYPKAPENSKFDSEIKFDLNQISARRLRQLTMAPPTLNSIDSLFSDSKLSNLENFRYLPPLVKVSDSIVANKKDIKNIPTKYFLGDYPSWGDNEMTLMMSKLMADLKNYPSQDVVFEKTSRNNNILGQFFEIVDNTVSKLDIVDFGYMQNDVGSDPNEKNRVFFIGKTFIDDRGTTCYVNLFTIVLSQRDRDPE